MFISFSDACPESLGLIISFLKVFCLLSETINLYKQRFSILDNSFILGVVHSICFSFSFYFREIKNLFHVDILNLKGGRLSKNIFN